MTTVEFPAGTERLADTARRLLPAAAAATLCLMIVLEYSGGFGVLDRFSPVSLFSGCLAVAALVAVLRLLWAPVRVPWAPALALVGFLLAETLSYAGSRLDPSVTGAALTQTLKLVLYAGVVCVLAAEWHAWQPLAWSIVAPMAAISALAVANQFVLGNAQSFLGFETVTDYLGVGVTTARHAGPLPDPNFWGRFLVVGVPLALALCQDAWTRARRGPAAVAAGAAALLVGGIYLTGSRGTFLAAGVALVVYAIAAGVRLIHLVAALPAAGLLLLVPGVGSRLFTFGPENGMSQLAAGDQSVAARLGTQEVAWSMVQDRPLTGVGPGGYFAAFGDYAATGGVQIDRVIAPHNLYLGMLAQVGVVGLLAFGAVLLVGLACAGRTLWATRGMSTADCRRIRPYAAALLAGTLAWCAASVFLHLTYARVLVLLVVLAASLWQQARRLPRVRSTAVSRRGRRLGCGAVAGVLLAASAGVATTWLAPHGAEATRTAVVEPIQRTGGFGAYLNSLRTRSGIVPGYAVVIDAAAPTPVDAQGSPDTGTVTVTTKADRPEEATAHLHEAIRSGTTALQRVGMDRVFTVRWLPGTRVTEAAPSATGLLAVGLVAGAGGGLLGLAVAARSERRRWGWAS